MNRQERKKTGNTKHFAKWEKSSSEVASQSTNLFASLASLAVVSASQHRPNYELQRAKLTSSKAPRENRTSPLVR